MKKVLILGAGLIAKPIVSYLLDKGYRVTVADRIKSKAKDMTRGHVNGTAVEWTTDDTETLDKMVEDHDLSVSLLPYAHHPLVAKHCLKHGKNMITTSYVKPEMQALDKEAKNKGIIILNELGLDPGIDHMSAMRIINHVHNNNGRIEEFYSICGALPSPESLDNPFRYKFSWSPKGVLMASNNPGKYLKKGKEVNVSGEKLFEDRFSVEFPRIGELEVYPNRDSMSYIDLYGIPETQTMYRGTFRHPGWCESIDAMKKLKLLDYEKRDFSGKTYAEFMAIMAECESKENIKSKVASALSLNEYAHALKAMEWLGLFEERPMNRETDSPFEIVSDLMMEKMMTGKNERDMVVMQHVFVASYPEGKKEVIKSSLLDFGTPGGDTAVAKTVALPAAIAVEMILDGKINSTGVHIPVIPDIYNPILDRLEKMDIKMHEEYGLPMSEHIDK